MRHTDKSRVIVKVRKSTFFCSNYYLRILSRNNIIVFGKN